MIAFYFCIPMKCAALLSSVRCVQLDLSSRGKMEIDSYSPSPPVLHVLYSFMCVLYSFGSIVIHEIKSV